MIQERNYPDAKGLTRGELPPDQRIWLENPAAFIPGNQMPVRGLDNAKARQDLIAYLKLGSEGKAKSQAGGMMQSRGRNLKQLEPVYRITAIRYCQDSYFVSTEDGGMRPFWEPNLRFKTDSSEIGPTPGHPVILPAGMMGDRASVFFSSPDEISPFIQKRC